MARVKCGKYDSENVTLRLNLQLSSAFDPTILTWHDVVACCLLAACTLPGTVFRIKMRFDPHCASQRSIDPRVLTFDPAGVYCDNKKMDL